MPPPLSVTLPPPSMTILGPVSLKTFAVSVERDGHRIGAAVERDDAALGDGATNAAPVQLAAVPSPTTVRGLEMSSSRASAGTAQWPSGLPAGGPPVGSVGMNPPAPVTPPAPVDAPPWPPWAAPEPTVPLPHPAASATVAASARPARPQVPARNMGLMTRPISRYHPARPARRTVYAARRKKKSPRNVEPSRLRTTAVTTLPHLESVPVPAPETPTGATADNAENLTVPERTARVEARDLEIKTLGPCLHESPVALRLGQAAVHPVGRSERLLLDDRFSRVVAEGYSSLPTFELAGPRNRIFFDPAKLRCGIVTCGGLCPGINNVMRGLVLELTHGYGVKEILGFRYGFEGPGRALRARRRCALGRRDRRRRSTTKGGTLLGTSRGEQDPREMVDRLDELGIGVLFVVGGDGTLAAAMKLVAELERRDLPIGVIGIPKTIDNDIHFIDRSFGFESAFSAAVEVIRSAHVEATGASNGIGLVKLMGRHSGFIACHAALALDRRRRRAHPRGAASPGRRARVPARSSSGGWSSTRTRSSSSPRARVRSSARRRPAPARHRRERQRAARRHRRRAARSHQRALSKRAASTITLKYIDPSYHIRSVPASPPTASTAGTWRATPCTRRWPATPRC